MFWSVSQQVSGQGLYATDISLLVQTSVFGQASVHMCVWWQMRGGSHRAHRDGADNLRSLSSGRSGLIWAWQRVPHTLSTYSVGFFQSFIYTLRRKYIHSPQTQPSVYAACWDFKVIENEYLLWSDQCHTVEEKRKADGQKDWLKRRIWESKAFENRHNDKRKRPQLKKKPDKLVHLVQT